METPGELIDRCRLGEPDAFEELVRLTHRDVYSLALRLMGNPDDAAEVSQDTYIKVLRKIKSFRGDAKFSTWLYRVTANAAISALRQRSRRGVNEGSIDEMQWMELPASPAGGPELQYERKVLRERLDAALRVLPESARVVVVLRDVYGLPLDDIGRQLGITEGAAKVRLFRARQRLKTILTEGTAPQVSAHDVDGTERVLKRRSQGL